MGEAIDGCGGQPTEAVEGGLREIWEADSGNRSEDGIHTQHPARNGRGVSVSRFWCGPAYS